MKQSVNLALALIFASGLRVWGQSHPVPGIIQAEDYDLGGESVAYHDTTSGNAGGVYRTDDVDVFYSTNADNNYYVSGIQAVEWLRYTATVAAAGKYQVRYRVASTNTTMTLRLSVDTNTVNMVNISGTANGLAWTNLVSSAPFNLTAGTHQLRLDFLTANFNIDEFEISAYTNAISTYLDSSASVSARVADLLGQMTLDEKVGQMCQASKGYIPAADVKNYLMGSVLSGGGEAPSPNTPQAWADMTDTFQSYALSTRLRIPILYGSDAVHGHNNVFGATIFPHHIGMGATRDPALMTRAAQVTAEEVVATGVNWAFGPTIAVSRNEWWGRSYESFSELPGLVGQMGAAEITGFQGTATNVLACAKHFAGDGGTLWGTGAGGKIDQGNTVADDATFQALFLAPYQPAISAGAMTIMVSFSSVNGVKMHTNTNLITNVLKGQMGFNGFVISDWAGINAIDSNYSNAVVKAVNAGIDMVMVPDVYKTFLTNLKGAVLSGRVASNRVDDAVSRILTVKFQAGVFEQPYARRQFLADVGSAAHRAVARQAVAESLVVLKNNSNLIPLPKNLSRIHVAGKNANNLGNQCGGWTISWQGASGATTTGTTILQGISNAVSAGTAVTYSLDGAGAAGANVGIAVVGETPYAEGAGDTQNLFLSAADLLTITNMHAAGIPVIVILVSGRPMYVESQVTNWDAFIAAWLPGTEGEGVADVLFGDVSPRGMLSFSWPRNNQVPVNVGDSGYNPLFAYGYNAYGNGAFQIVNAAYSLASSNAPAFNVTVSTVPGYKYTIQYADQLPTTSSGWNTFTNASNGFGTWIETNSTASTYTFVDDFTALTSGEASLAARYYRVRSEPAAY